MIFDISDINMSNNTSIDWLPDEIIKNEIFSYFTPGVLRKVSEVSKKFQSFATVDALWERHFKENFSVELDSMHLCPLPDSYYKLFKYCRLKQVTSQFSSSFEINKYFKLLNYIEKNDLGLIKEFIEKNDFKLKFTDFFTSNNRQLPTLINQQNNQELRDISFKLVLCEYIDTSKLSVKQLMLTEHADIYSVLAATGALLLDSVDEFGFFIFDWACIFGQIEFLNKPEMLTISPDILMDTTRGGPLPLQLCALVGSLDGMTFLIDRGVKIEGVTEFWKNPALSMCFRTQQMAAIHLLLQKGAVPIGTLCPLKFAGELGNTALAKLYLTRYPEKFTIETVIKAAQEAVEHNNFDTFSYLFTYLEDEKNTPMVDHLIKYVNFFGDLCSPTTICKFLLDKGANPDSLMKQGLTLLQRAVNSGNLKAVKILLQKGADVNLRSPYYSFQSIISMTLSRLGIHPDDEDNVIKMITLILAPENKYCIDEYDVKDLRDAIKKLRKIGHDTANHLENLLLEKLTDSEIDLMDYSSSEESSSFDFGDSSSSSDDSL